MLFNFLKRKKPFSLRTRFLLATSVIILALTFSYGAVAIVGYLVVLIKQPIPYYVAKVIYFIAWRNGVIIS